MSYLPFDLIDLDDKTRSVMIDELLHDIENDSIYFSPRLSDFGKTRYSALLQSAFTEDPS